MFGPRAVCCPASRSPSRCAGRPPTGDAGGPSRVLSPPHTFQRPKGPASCLSSLAPRGSTWLLIPESGRRSRKTPGLPSAVPRPCGGPTSTPPAVQSLKGAGGPIPSCRPVGHGGGHAPPLQVRTAVTVSVHRAFRSCFGAFPELRGRCVATCSLKALPTRPARPWVTAPVVAAPVLPAAAVFAGKRAQLRCLTALSCDTSFVLFWGHFARHSPPSFSNLKITKMKQNDNKKPRSQSCPGEE